VQITTGQGDGPFTNTQWKNAHFYPSLRDIAPQHVFKKLCYDGSNIFVPGDDPTSYFGSAYRGNVKVWYLNFLAV
jgi:hypothetical protein